MVSICQFHFLGPFFFFCSLAVGAEGERPGNKLEYELCSQIKGDWVWFCVLWDKQHKSYKVRKSTPSLAKLSGLVLRNEWIATHCLDIYIFLRNLWKFLKACISLIQYWLDKHQPWWCLKVQTATLGYVGSMLLHDPIIHGLIASHSPRQFAPLYSKWI